MRIKFILFNILLIIFLFILVYLFIYVNYNNYEKFEVQNVVSITTSNDNSNNLESGEYVILDDKTNRYKDGSSVELSAISAEILVFINKFSNSNKKLTDNYYWINLPNVGPKYIYCITNTNFFGGGWMLALRGVKGSKTFNFNSNHWKKNTTLNSNYDTIKDLIIQYKLKNEFNISSLGNLIYKDNFKDEEINNFDAKFDTFNEYPAKEWMAIFYTKNNNIIMIGGDYINDNKRGWIWYEKNISYKNKNNYTLLELFNILDNDKVKLNQINLYPNNTPDKLDKIKSNYRYPQNIIIDNNNKSIKKNMWSTQEGYKFYGINYIGIDYGIDRGTSVRWGFAWNNENDEYTNDVYNGIGLEYYKKTGGNSAGDFNHWGESKSLSFEWYIR